MMGHAMMPMMGMMRQDAEIPAAEEDGSVDIVDQVKNASYIS